MGRSSNANRGYIGWSESYRSACAKEMGTFPKTLFKKEYGISEKVFNQIKDAGGFDKEWHHTSKYFNKTDFYAWNESGIEMLARINFDKYIDTIVGYLNRDEFMWFGGWYQELWDEEEPCMPLINLVCDKMIDEEDERKQQMEDEHLMFVNMEWFAKWKKQNGFAYDMRSDYDKRNDKLFLYRLATQMIAERVDGRYVFKTVEESHNECVLQNYERHYGQWGSISINEYDYRCGVVALLDSTHNDLSKHIAEIEKAHNIASSCTRDYILEKYANSSELDYLLSLHDRYAANYDMYICVVSYNGSEISLTCAGSDLSVVRNANKYTTRTRRNHMLLFVNEVRHEYEKMSDGVWVSKDGETITINENEIITNNETLHV